MTWLVWRQHRYEIIVMLGGAALIAAMLIYGADLAVRTRAELGVDTCPPLVVDTYVLVDNVWTRGIATETVTDPNCTSLELQLAERVQPFRWLIVFLFFVPAVVGAFVGGPLFSREFERGTHRLVWTQGITRLRWAAGKLIGLLAAGVAAATIVALFGGLAERIIGGGTDRYTNFRLEGPAFVSYVVFAIAIAAFAGTLSRRILGGMLLGLLVFGAVQFFVQYAVRPHYEAPVVASMANAEDAARGLQVPEGSWFLGTDHLSAAGEVVDPTRVRSLTDAYRPGRDPLRYNMLAYLAENGVYQRVRYHPPDRYWRFQWTEAALFLTLAAVTSIGTLQLIRRRDA
jgi:hypothetical protein